MNNLSEFSSFLLSLASSASYYMEEKTINLDIAKHTIGTLELLQVKTKNNLTKLEETLLEDLLYKLRLEYLNLKNKK